MPLSGPRLLREDAAPGGGARLYDGAIAQSAFRFSKIRKQLSFSILSHLLNASRHLLSLYLTNDAIQKVCSLLASRISFAERRATIRHIAWSGTTKCRSLSCL
jgi:hypothetical protein